jgi:nitrogen fixation protein NifQ
MNAVEPAAKRELIFTALMGAGQRSDPNRALLASMLAGHAIGEGCLPAHLGLGSPLLGRIMSEYFPGQVLLDDGGSAPPCPEYEDLRRLLLECRAQERESEIWIADIVAVACGGANHLWQDLGLANRDELSRLMHANFPSLARANTGDMKWKKFIYKQLCAREGIYVCPAPSCNVCSDYAKCFAPEN